MSKTNRFPFASGLAAIVSAAAAVPTSGAADKVTMCHKDRHEVTVDENALSAHLRHGDFIGPCTVVSATRPVTIGSRRQL